MEQRLKQRLLGAVVIVSLAAIFLPLVFDGEGYQQLSRVDLEAPLSPRISFDQSFPELRDSEVVSTREQISVRDLPSTATSQDGTAR